MKITDIDGKEITVTDLETAIIQAGAYKEYHHDPPQPVADNRQQAYWTDVYNKLLQLQTKKQQQ